MSNTNNKNEMLTVAQVAQMLGISYAAALKRVESMPGVLELKGAGEEAAQANAAGSTRCCRGLHP